mgnify:CR=1 FL=1
MSLTLEELAIHIRQTLPTPRAISHLELKPGLEAITFNWQRRHFFVRNTMQVLELKGDKLFITGASMLAQLVLMKRSRQDSVLETVVTTLREVEEMLSSPGRMESGLKLLAVVKASLARLVGSKRPGRSASGPARSSTASGHPHAPHNLNALR